MTAWTEERRAREAKRQAAIDRAKHELIERLNKLAGYARKIDPTTHLEFWTLVEPDPDPRWRTRIPAARWATGPAGVLFSTIMETRKAPLLDELAAALEEPGVDPLQLVQRFRPDIDVRKTQEEVEAEDAAERARTDRHNTENARRHANGTWRPDWCREPCRC